MSDTTLAAGALVLIIGVALLIFEIVHPGVFLLIPGTVLTVSGVVLLVVPDILLGSIWGPIIIAVVAVGAMIGSIPLYRHVAPVSPPEVPIPSTMSGRQGLVVAAVVPHSLRGKVRIDTEVWSASADEPIAAGTLVRVVGGEGVAVRVVPVAPGGTP